MGRALVTTLVRLSIESATSVVGAPLVGALGLGGHKGRPYKERLSYTPFWDRHGTTVTQRTTVNEYDRTAAALYDYYDRAPAMLSIARQKLSKLSVETQSRIELVEGDMRDFSLGQRVKLIMIPYRAFLHLLTPKDQRRALECMREHLTDDGRLVFNIFDPNLELIAARLSPLGSALKKDAEFMHPHTGHRVVVWQTHQFDPERQMLELYFIFEELEDGGRVVAKLYSPLTLRYVYRYEMRYLLELCGYKVEALYGDFQRGPFRYGGEQIWVARKS